MSRRFFVYATQGAALADAQTMTDRGRVLFVAAGYPVDGDDNVIGRRNGVPALDAQPTEVWDVPRQRLDGKWIVEHPESMPAAGQPAPGGVTVLAYVIQGITAAVETYSPEWFPTLRGF